MKTAKTILGSLVGTPVFHSLSPHSCYRKFLALLPPRFQKAIAFITLKNGRLMVALSHPGYKMELNYNKDLLKSLLSTLREHHGECAFMEADEIIFFPSKYREIPSSEKLRDSIPRYTEQAKGTFEEKIRDPDLHAVFDRLKKLIRSRRKQGN